MADPITSRDESSLFQNDCLPDKGAGRGSGQKASVVHAMRCCKKGPTKSVTGDPRCSQQKPKRRELYANALRLCCPRPIATVFSRNPATSECQRSQNTVTYFKRGIVHWQWTPQKMLNLGTLKEMRSSDKSWAMSLESLSTDRLNSV